jgi:hypothetical protein
MNCKKWINYGKRENKNKNLKSIKIKLSKITQNHRENGFKFEILG